MNSKVGMMALLEGTEKMAALDWRVAPVPWRNHFANPGRPLKVSGTEEERKSIENSDWILHQRRNLSSHSRNVKGSQGNCRPAQGGGT